MKSAEARLLRASSSLPGKLQPTSPLPSQSKSGATSSLSSAMNPSKDTAATPMIVLPMFVLSSFCSCSRSAPFDFVVASEWWADRQQLGDRLLRLLFLLRPPGAGRVIAPALAHAQ